MATLRVVSWNIRAAIGTGPFPNRWWTRIDADRLRAIGVVLSALDADLIALQEVALVSRDGDLVDNAGDLARQLGIEVRYGAVRTFSVTDGGAVTGVGSFGNAILSRLPLQSARTVALPRAAIDAFVEPPGADHPAAGITYADAPDTIRGDASPALLLGDMNAAIDAPELEAFATWTDGFAEPPGDPARISTDDGWRIDQVLARGASVSPARVLCESGDLSDHHPVVAEIGPG